jgi:hypothetical protein
MTVKKFFEFWFPLTGLNAPQFGRKKHSIVRPPETGTVRPVAAQRFSPERRARLV